MSRRSARPVPAIDPAADCPCGLDRSYRDCCGVFHAAAATAPTAAALMRSRFSAFAVHDDAYLLRTWHPTTRPPRIEFEPDLLWTRLHILRTTGGTLLHTEGTVDFRADYSVRGRPDSMHEHSRFVREDGGWLYVGPIALRGHLPS